MEKLRHSPSASYGKKLLDINPICFKFKDLEKITDVPRGSSVSLSPRLISHCFSTPQASQNGDNLTKLMLIFSYFPHKSLFIKHKVGGITEKNCNKT